MDHERESFLFGAPLRPGDRPANDDQRRRLLARAHPGLPPYALPALNLLAGQVLADDPPEVWSTVQRLLSAGQESGSVTRQLVLTLAGHVVDLVEPRRLDTVSYLDELTRLPLPDDGDVDRALLSASRARVSATMEELQNDAADALGVRAGDSGVAAVLDRRLNELIMSGGELEMIIGDVVVHVRSVLHGRVLTCRVRALDRDADALTESADLSPFARCGRLPSVPDGPGAALAVRVVDGGLTAKRLDREPDVRPEVVSLLRDCYDRAVAEPWLPVSLEELVLLATLNRPDTFTTPQAPVGDLVAVAGLELRGTLVAHEESVWQADRQRVHLHRLVERLAPDQMSAVVEVLGAVRGELGVDQARRLLTQLDDPEVLDGVLELGFPRGQETGDQHAFVRLCEALLAAAARPRQKAVACWLLSVVAEREQDLDRAEQLLRDAVRVAPDWGPGVDRLAWYRSDSGDAEGALALWRGLGLTADESDDLRELEALPLAAREASLGRNDRCWCGSGRKFKQCHLGLTEPLPLPDRVGWLCRKSTAFLERAGTEATEDIVAHVAARAVDPEDRAGIQAAVQDPLVLDVVQFEGGWFARFLAERGHLLPDDEALLAQAWLLVERTVVEVVATRPGQGLTVRDLRAGEVFEVRERTFSRTARVGRRYCARPVPDGESVQFVGGLFEVAPGTERTLLELLDSGEGLALLEYVADLHRPPVVVGPDSAILDLSDLPPGPAAPLVSLPDGVAEQVMTQLEERWCSEPVPALDGLTPQQAVADPTRRDDVARLIDSFPEHDLATGVLSLRPDALRDRLRLPGRSG